MRDQASESRAGFAMLRIKVVPAVRMHTDSVHEWRKQNDETKSEKKKDETKKEQLLNILEDRTAPTVRAQQQWHTTPLAVPTYASRNPLCL